MTPTPNDECREALLQKIGARFSSGNSVPVERAYLTANEFDQIAAWDRRAPAPAQIAAAKCEHDWRLHTASGIITCSLCFQEKGAVESPPADADILNATTAMLARRPDLLAQLKRQLFAPAQAAQRVETARLCKGCGKPILIANGLMDDGCPCNTTRGVNVKPTPCTICGIEDCVKPAHHTRDCWVTSPQQGKSEKGEAVVSDAKIETALNAYFGDSSEYVAPRERMRKALLAVMLPAPAPQPTAEGETNPNGVTE